MVENANKKDQNWARSSLQPFDSFQVEIQVETLRYETKYLLSLINIFRDYAP